MSGGLPSPGGETAREVPAGLRIAHFSDIHVSIEPSAMRWRDLLSKRFLGWMNLAILRRHKLFADAGAVLEAFLADLREVRPDHVVSTGDLTGIALPEEFDRAAALLAPLLGRDDVTGIPGNHDVYVASAVRQKLYERSFGAWERTDLAAGELPPDLRPLYPYPLVRFLEGGVALIALKDVKPNALHDSSGRVGRLQLRALEHVLALPAVRARPTRILAMHTGVRKASGRRDRSIHGLRDGAALLAAAAAGGVSLLIHGHTHRRFVLEKGPLTPVSTANAGSLTSAHHERSYNVYNCRPGSIEVAARRYDPARRAFAPWPEASGTRLETHG